METRKSKKQWTAEIGVTFHWIPMAPRHGFNAHKGLAKIKGEQG